jgi:CubicO group peptidase (beta-lactamase class C family)
MLPSGTATGRATPQRRILRVIVMVMGGLLLAISGVHLWAWSALETSTAARAIWWKQADVDDQFRFPERQVQPAGAPRTLDRSDAHTPASGLLEKLVDGDPLIDVLARTGTTAFLVVRDGYLIDEHYPDDGGRDSRQTSFSVAKSFVSALVGAAIDRGDIAAVDDPITDYLPELVDEDPRFGTITVRHLLTMSSGLRYQERGLPWSDDAVTYYAPDLRDAALGAAIERDPGEEFLYNNYNPLLLGIVLERVTGETVAHLLERDLWQPMGAEAPASWSLDESGFEKMESGINALAIDFARFGQLYLDQGRIDGHQVLSRAWIAESTVHDETTTPSRDYQYLWWVDTERPGRFYAAGNHGQFIYVSPDSDTVVVRTGRSWGRDMTMHDWVAVLRDVADEAGTYRL